MKDNYKLPQRFALIILISLAILLFIYYYKNISNDISFILLNFVLTSFSSIFFYIIFSFTTEKKLIDRVVSESSQKAINEISSKLTSVYPEAIYEESILPSKKFNRDFIEKIKQSNTYYYLGDTGKSTSLRLYSAIEDLCLEQYNIILIHPLRANESIKRVAFLRLDQKGIKNPTNHQLELDLEICLIKMDIFITIYLLFEFANRYSVRISGKVFFIDRTPAYYIHSLNNCIFLSFYLGQIHPQTYRYQENSQIHLAFNHECKTICEYQNSFIEIKDGISYDIIDKQLDPYGLKETINDYCNLKKIPLANTIDERKKLLGRLAKKRCSDIKIEI